MKYLVSNILYGLNDIRIAEPVNVKSEKKRTFLKCGCLQNLNYLSIESTQVRSIIVILLILAKPSRTYVDY